MDLPPELRNCVYEAIFFGGKDNQKQFDNWLINPNKRRLPWYHIDIRLRGAVSTSTDWDMFSGSKYHIHRYQPRLHFFGHTFGLAIFRASHQMHDEAAPIFYGRAIFSLLSFPLSGEVPSYEFLEQLPRKYRRLIRCVEFFSFNQALTFSDPTADRSGFSYLRLFDWVILIHFLTRECPRMQNLTLWPVTYREKTDFYQQRKDMLWIEAIINLPGYQHFEVDTSVVCDLPGGVENYKSIRICPDGTEIVPWLQRYVLHDSVWTKPRPFLQMFLSKQKFQRLPFLSLPTKVRTLVYRLTLLPPSRELHPYIRSWCDVTTRSVVPLFSTCRQIRQEAEEVLYGDAIFSVPHAVSKYAGRLKAFFEALEPRLRAKIRRVLLPAQMNNCDATLGLLTYISENMALEELICVILGDAAIARFNYLLPHRHQRLRLQPAFEKLKKVSVRVLGATKLLPEAQHWLEHGLRDQYLEGLARRQSLRSSGKIYART